MQVVSAGGVLLWSEETLAMRILIGSYPAVTILEGGIHTQATSLQRELVKLGHQAELFETWRQYDLKTWDWFYLVGAHVGTVHLAWALNDLGVRLAVSPVFFTRRSLSSLRLRIVWDSLWQRGAGMTSALTMTRDSCRVADVVMPNTAAEAELVTRGLSITPGKVKLLPNGCDEQFYSARPDAFVREYGRKDFVLYVGHMGFGRKNLLTLVRAMQGVNRPLVIIARIMDNAYARQCQEEAKRLKDCLIIPALAQDSELLASAYAACDTLCLPSSFETPGLAALEAGLAGAKLVVTKYGGTREYFGEMVRYVEPGDVRVLQQAIQSSLEAVRDDRLKEHIRANFLWRHAAVRFVECLSP